MTFLTPWLLGGAALAAVPVILHLVMRQQPQHVTFPALRFLRLDRVSNRQRLKLRHLLLLALRVAAIVLLALALARPSLRGSGDVAGKSAPVAAVLVVDTTVPMDLQHQGATRLEQAQEVAGKILAQLPADSRVAVVDSRTLAPAFAYDLATARQQVERLRIATVPRSMGVMIESGLKLLGDEIDRGLMRREMYVFSDLTRSRWAGSSQGQLETLLAELDDVGLYVVDVGVEQPQNFALGELDLPRPVIAQGSPLQVRVALRRTGPAASGAVELLIESAEGNQQKRGQKNVEWDEALDGEAAFRLMGLDVGTHQGRVRIAGDDGLAWDNQRFFTVEVRPPWPVLVAAARRPDAVFLTQAIAPDSFRDSGGARFACDVVDLDQLAQKQLDDYAVVCLLDPTPLSDGVFDALADYAEAGGSVAIFLGRNARVAQMNEKDAQRLLPAPLAFTDRNETYLTEVRASHPIVAPFQPLAGSVPWNSFPVMSHWRLGQPRAGNVAEIFRYASGSPAVLERAVGSGKVITMTTPISDPTNDPGRPPWNYLHADIGGEPWPFVILVNEMMLYLAGSGSQRLNYEAGQTAVLRFHGKAPQAVSLVDPEGIVSNPQVDLTDNSLRVTATDAPGHYRVKAGGRGGIDRGFSVNVSAQFSDLSRLLPEELEEILTDRYQLAADVSQLQRQQDRGRVGRELFPLLILLLAVVIGCEQVLANRFYRRAR